jgi:glucokinase
MVAREAFAGVDIGGTRTKIGLCDPSGAILSLDIVETGSYDGAESLLDAIAETLRSRAAVASVSLAGVGVGCPGRIDYASGKVIWLQGKLEFLEGFPLVARLGDALGCRVVCDNDVNVILAGEMRFGAGRGYRDVIAVTVGTGIGGALAVQGQMVRGRNWAAGHFGYMSIDPQGPAHVCGNSGTVEEHASQSGIRDKLRRALDSGTDSRLTRLMAQGEKPGLRDVFDAAEEGDALGREMARRLIFDVGVLIANLIYALDPEVVLVGGGIVCNREGILDEIRREVARRVAYLPADGTQIVPTALGDAAGVLGGVALALDAIAEHAEGGNEE